MERVKRLDVEAGSSILLSIANGLFSQKQSRFTDDYINKVKKQNSFTIAVYLIDF